MSRYARTGLCAVALAAVALAVAGCGIPTDDNPRAISNDSVPDDAGEDTTETTATEPTVPAPIFLVQSPDDPRLVEVERRVPAGSPAAAPDPAAVLETLLSATPNTREQAGGITNLIPEDTRLASQPQLARGGTLIVDLTTEIFDVEGENQRAAFGQIACTASALEGVDSVRFLVEGGSTGVPMDSGSTERPVTCANDYARLLAEPAAG